MRYPTLWQGTTPAAWADLLGTRREFDRVFDRFFDRAAEADLALVPAVDVRETAERIEVAAELPGLQIDDVDVSLVNNVLTITGEKKHEVTEGDSDSNYHLLERCYGRFERSFTLPRTVDANKISARFDNGVLTVALPKAETAKPRRIEVSVGK